MFSPFPQCNAVVSPHLNLPIFSKSSATSLTQDQLGFSFSDSWFPCPIRGGHNIRRASGCISPYPSSIPPDFQTGSAQPVPWRGHIVFTIKMGMSQIKCLFQIELLHGYALQIIDRGFPSGCGRIQLRHLRSDRFDQHPNRSYCKDKFQGSWSSGKRPPYRLTIFAFPSYS